MGALDEIRKQFAIWVKPIIKNIQALHVVVNSGFDTKIRQEASGFSNIWSGLNDIELDIEQLVRVNNSGFDTKIRQERSGFLWIDTGLGRIATINNSGFDTKIRQEASGFSNLWSGVRQLRTINRSGFNDLEADLERLVGINHSGFDIKIRQEASGFGNTWSGLREVRDEVIQLQGINRSGFASIVINVSGLIVNVSGLENINRSGFLGIWARLDTKIIQEHSGFINTWSGLREIETTANAVQSGVRLLRQGETLTLSTQENIKNISGMVSGTLGCYDRWTLYLQASGATNITLELTPDITPPYFWFEPPESPIALASGTVLEMGYDATFVRIYADSGVGVTGRIRGCW